MSRRSPSFSHMRLNCFKAFSIESFSLTMILAKRNSPRFQFFQWPFFVQLFVQR